MGKGPLGKNGFLFEQWFLLEFAMTKKIISLVDPMGFGDHL